MKDQEVSIRPLTAVEVKNQINLIQEIMRGVMKEGEHYGKIPGCGDKPSLLKAGAEKLSMTFRLRPLINNIGDIIVNDLDNNHREVTVYCHITDSRGLELSTGVGSCSTMESKYRYRGGEKVSTGQPVPTEYWNLRKEGKITEAQDKIGGKNFGVAKIDSKWEICEIGEKMENPDIADTYNTVLKMAVKRAYVDGILKATAASDIFTQDLEDFADNIHKPVIIKGKPEVEIPKAKEKKEEVPLQKEPPKEVEKTNAYKQLLDNFAKAKKKIGEDLYYKILGEFGFEHANECRKVEEGMKIIEEMRRAYEAITEK